MKLRRAHGSDDIKCNGLATYVEDADWLLSSNLLSRLCVVLHR